MISLISCKIHGLHIPIYCLVWYGNLKDLEFVMPFLTFKGITHAYLLKISITNNKKQINLLKLLIN